MCAGEHVAVVGGGNSAGQAAMFLAEKADSVCVVVRRPLAATMSSYLVDRITNHPRVQVHEGMTVTALAGDTTLERITVSSADARHEVDCTALFSFIGAEPNSAWLDGVAVDEHGFVLTDRALDQDMLGEAWCAMGRRPLPYETSWPGLFAVGDLRSGSTNGSPRPSARDPRRSVRCTSTSPSPSTPDVGVTAPVPRGQIRPGASAPASANTPRMLAGEQFRREATTDRRGLGADAAAETLESKGRGELRLCRTSPTWHAIGEALPTRVRRTGDGKSSDSSKTRRSRKGHTRTHGDRHHRAARPRADVRATDQRREHQRHPAHSGVLAWPGCRRERRQVRRHRRLLLIRGPTQLEPGTASGRRRARSSFSRAQST